ncbi:MAG: flavin reductase family protein [Thermoprotei archaeon]|nr:MAG: flavin reductase family protein [Thermoprotei archaeon]RLE87791.1 MAG: flavin reductase family protein [Thermoprotei archaeon]
MFREVPSVWITRLLHPKLVVLVVTKDDEKVNAMAAAWCMPVSVKPPLVVVSISPKRYTYKLIKRKKEFTINVMSLDKMREVHICGTISGVKVDKIERAGLRLLKSTKIETPGLEDAIAVIECTLFNSVEAGDHELFIGQVVAARVRSDTFVNGVYCIDKVRLLYHLGGDMYTTTSSEVYRPT